MISFKIPSLLFTLLFLWFFTLLRSHFDKDNHCKHSQFSQLTFLRLSREFFGETFVKQISFSILNTTTITFVNRSLQQDEFTKNQSIVTDQSHVDNLTRATNEWHLRDTAIYTIHCRLLISRLPLWGSSAWTYTRFGAWHEDDGAFSPRPSSDAAAAAAGNDVDVAVVVVGTSVSMMMSARHSSLFATSALNVSQRGEARRGRRWWRKI